MIRDIETELEKHGFKSRIVSALRLKELQEEITEKRVKGYFCDEFFRELLTSFKFRPPKQLPKANSLLIAAYPQPKVCIIFSWKGKSHPVLLPPTYMHHPNAILEKVPLNRIPSSTRKKIEKLYMIDEYELLSRNLNSVLINSLFDKREE